MMPQEATSLALRARAESLGQPSPQLRHSRTNSMSSDRPSMTGHGGLLSPPMSTNPEPIYIAASAASQIVTNDHDSQSNSWFDQHGIEPSGETALVAPGALKLVNNFLDQILFNFLSLSRSTSLASLRPAVGEVLKPKLAKDAIGLADGELQEYLGGGEDEELLAFHNGLEPSGDWDLELVWKRTRLRCMVYSSLGDMEEEDEDHYTELEQLDGPPGSNNRFSNSSGVVSPAVAIFLTSILEFMGEQVLVVAGQAAYHRLHAKHEKEEREGTSTHGDIADRVVVEEMDVEKVALDRTLGRLWRGWKKRIRCPTPSESIGRSFSGESLRSRGHNRFDSMNNQSVPPVEEVFKDFSSTDEPPLDERAANIPLPLHHDDVREIEIPGVACQSDDEDDGQSGDEDLNSRRPKSMFIPRDLEEPLTPISWQPVSLSRKRSNSVPSPAAPNPMSLWQTSRAAQNGRASPEEATEGQDQSLDNSSHDQQSQKRTEEYEEAATAKPSNGSNRGTMAGFIASAAAMGAAAAAGITAAARGGAPETIHTTDEDSDMEEAFIEEPLIMTSSRVSLPGRISPEQATGDSKPGSVRASSVHSVRIIDVSSPRSPARSRHDSVGSQSVHSLRLVDVSSPRSPTRSRHGSVGSMDQITTVHSNTLSRPGSIHSYVAHEGQIPRGTSPISRVGSNSPISPIGRNGSAVGRRARNNSRDSISELEEQYIDPPRSTPVTPSDIPERSPLRGMAPAAIQAVSALRRDNERSQIPTSTQQLVNPAIRSARETAAVETQSLPTPAPSTLSAPVTRSPDSAAPAFTPSREAREVSYDSSNEPPPYVKIHSPPRTSSKFPPTQQYVDISGTPGSPKTGRGVGAERSRVSLTQEQRDGNVTPKQDLYNKAGRKIHTSSSSTSSGSHKLRPIRTSEDAMHSAGEDKGRSFEQLIHSDQTIQYTLTPQTMRELDSPDSPRSPQPPIAYTKPGDRPRTSSSASKLTALHSHPSPTADKSPRIPRSTANTGAKIRSSAPQQARDPRVERDSIGDFAEFIRSTGPPGATYDDILPTPRPVPEVNGHRGQNGTVRNVSTSSPRAEASPSSPTRSQSSATRRLQAREAVVPQSNNSSDLIDFIRQGPPSEKTHDNPRIPRTVAPFRTTMDSDQMSGAVGGKVPEPTGADPRHSQASQSNENSMRSVESSVTSQTALLNNYSSKKPSPPPKYNGFGDDDMMPKRKTRRVRDPYAIDLSDEEDEFDVLPAKPVSQEESLADFLRNVPPPAQPTTTPIFQTAEKPVAKKASAPSLIARLSRNSNSYTKSTPAHSSPQTTLRKNSTSHQKNSGSKTIITQSPASSPASSRRVNAASNSNYVSRLDSERKPGKVVQKTFEPREATSPRAPTRTATSDLADFLKNTPPPLSNGPQRLAIGSEAKEEGGFARMFSRRKKATAA